MSKLRQFITNHYIALVLSVLVGLLMVLPQLLFIIQAGDDYTGVNILNIDAESNYLSRFREIDEGDWGLKDAFWTFNNEGPYQRPHLGQLIVYYFGQLFFLNVGQIFLLAKFILPITLFLVIYFSALSIQSDRKIALASTVGVMLWYGITSDSELSSFLANNFVIPRYSIFSRPIIPVFGIITLFSFIFSFYCYINKSKKKCFWLSGIILGLSFYIYFFTWGFLLVFIFVSFFWFWFKKDWFKLKMILKVMLLGALVGLPYWFNFYKLINSELFNLSANEVGLIFSNSIIIGKYLVLAWVLYFLGIMTKRIQGKDLWLWTSVVISFVIILNQQLITHRILQPGHYHWYVVKPLTIFLLSLLVFDLIKRKGSKLFIPLVTLFIITGFYLVTSQEIFTYNKFKDETVQHSQRYGPVYQWINQNIEKNQVFFAGTLEIEPAHLISSHIHLDEYLYVSRFFNLPSLEENKFVTFLEYRLSQITPVMAQDLFFNQLREETFIKICDFYRYLVIYSKTNQPPTDQEVQDLVDQYTEFYQKDLKGEFEKYPIDYLIWDKDLRSNWNPDDYDFLELIHQSEWMNVYRFLH